MFQKDNIALRSKIKAHFPMLVPAVRLARKVNERYVQGWPLMFKSQREIFNTIYETNLWGDAHSRSGPGSNLIQTEQVRHALPRLIRNLHISTMLDIPCGDFHWMKELDLQLEQYIGADIVEEIVKQNVSRYGSDKRQFVHLDIVKDRLPKADLILCRDLFGHFSFKDIKNAVTRIKASGSTYLLTTTYVDTTVNEHIFTGLFRPINLEKPPFNFPTPLEIINEQCTEDVSLYKDKSLALWRIKDL
jgi:hypothetical protein